MVKRIRRVAEVILSRHVQTHMGAGVLPATKFGRNWMVHNRDLGE